MIIDFTHTWETYSEIENQYDLSGYKCPVCSRNDSLVRHGSYYRYLLGISQENAVGCAAEIAVKEIRMKILRVKCRMCNKTHAILSGDVIPGRVYSYSLMFAVFMCVFEKKQSILDVQKKTGVGFQTLYRFLAVLYFYKKIYSEKIAELKSLNLIFTSDYISIREFLIKFFHKFKVPFLTGSIKSSISTFEEKI